MQLSIISLTNLKHIIIMLQFLQLCQFMRGIITLKQRTKPIKQGQTIYHLQDENLISKNKYFHEFRNLEIYTYNTYKTMNKSTLLLLNPTCSGFRCFALCNTSKKQQTKLVSECTYLLSITVNMAQLDLPFQIV